MLRNYGVDYMRSYIKIFKDSNETINPETSCSLFQGSNLHLRCKNLVKKFQNFLDISSDDKKFEAYLKSREGIVEFLITICSTNSDKFLDIVRLGKYHYSTSMIKKLGSKLPIYYIKKTTKGVICVAHHPDHFRSSLGYRNPRDIRCGKYGVHIIDFEKKLVE